MPRVLAGGAIPCVQPKREPGRASKILHETNCGNRNATRRNREFRNKPGQTVGSVETKIVNFYRGRIQPIACSIDEAVPRGGERKLGTIRDAYLVEDPREVMLDCPLAQGEARRDFPVVA